MPKKRERGGAIGVLSRNGDRARRDVDREFASQMSSSLAIVVRGERGNGEERRNGREGEEREREVENREEERQMIKSAKKSEEL